MSPFQAYELYTSLKLHFTSDSYNFNKFNGKCNVSNASFLKRKDRYFFYKLSKKKDPKGFLLANIVSSESNATSKVWIGNIINDDNSEKIYTEWLARQESISYHFKTQMSKHFDGNYKQMLTVVDGQHPEALSLLISGDLTYESIIMLDSYFYILPYWKKNITDTIIWPEYHKILYKYKDFVIFNKDKVKQIIQDTK